MKLYDKMRQARVQPHASLPRAISILGMAIWVSLLTPSVGFSDCVGPTTIVVNHVQDQVASCQNIVDALDSIDCASSARRYVVKLEPGNYICPDKKLVMKPYVDLVGSGIKSTRITGRGAWDETNARWVLVEGASFSEVRDFELKMTPPATDDAVAVLNDGVNARLNNLKIIVKFGKDCRGVLNQSLEGVEVGPDLVESYVDVKKCDTSIGVENRGTVLPKIRRSYIMGSNAKFSNIGIFYNLFGIMSNPGIELWDVKASAYGNHDVDTSECYAVGFADSSVPPPGFITFYQSLLKAENCDAGNTGLKLNGGKAELHNCRIWARFVDPGFENIGIEMRTGTLRVHSSVVVGVTSALKADREAVAYFGASRVANGPFELTNGSKATCVNSYNNEFEALGNKCT